MRRLDRVGGTATILVTDLVGSTAMFDRLGDEKAERLLRVHLGQMRDLVRSFGGREVKSTGDGIMAAFPAAWLASECAVAMQRTLHLAREGGAEVPLHIRIGLHSGDTTADRHDYYGIAVAVAARLCDKASADGILMSGVTRGLVGSRGGHTFADAGEWELKGVDEPARAWTLGWEPGQLPPAPPPGLEPKKGRIVGAAASVLVLGAGGLFLMTNGDEPVRRAKPEVPGTVFRVSVTSDGAETTQASFSPDISGEGSSVVFASDAADLVASDENERVTDVFHVEIADGVVGGSIQLVSRTGRVQGNKASTEPSISDDGNVVAFLSDATNLAVKEDANRSRDVFMHLVDENETNRVSIATDDEAANKESYEVDVSGDGEFIAFTTAATNLAFQGDLNKRNDIFVRDVVAGKTNRANIQSNTLNEANRHSSDPSISEGGEFVAFGSKADTLSNGDTNNRADVFRYSRLRHKTVRASVPSGTGAPLNASGASSQPSISDDGSRIAFVSTAQNLTPEDTSTDPDVFVHDFDTDETILVTVAIDGRDTPNANTANPSISGDGNYVVFDSTAPNLVQGDENRVRDVFVYDLEGTKMTLISVPDDGAPPEQPSYDPEISDDGYVVFTSKAGLVVDDSNGAEDVYARGPLF